MTTSWTTSLESGTGPTGPGGTRPGGPAGDRPGGPPPPPPPPPTEPARARVAGLCALLTGPRKTNGQPGPAAR